MNMEIIVFTVAVSIFSLIIGIFLTAKFLPNILRSSFRNTAREELDDITQEVKEEQSKNEEDITKSIRELEKTLLDAKTVWKTNTTDITQEFRQLNRSFNAWEESLSNPGEQGALAEEGLEVMLEAAGLIKGVSFDTQITEQTDDGGTLRPDFYVYTPDNGVIIIDSKAPMTHYKNAIKAESEIEKNEALKKHANSMLTYAQDLGKKDYAQVTGRKTPDLVIMYVPNIAVYLAALEVRPNLIQEAWSKKVQICPPEAVYPVLKSIMLSWQQKKLYDNAEEIQKQTRVIHDRLRVFQGHLDKIGKSLGNASKDYNRSISSWDNRLTPAFRKLEEMSAVEESRKLEKLEEINDMPLEKKPLD